MEVISHQGIADRIARDYLDRHGRVHWADVEDGLRRPDPCPKLATYWTFHGCGYRKSACTCAVPLRLPRCIVPALPMRNGRLGQSAAAPYLFLRDWRSALIVVVNIPLSILAVMIALWGVRQTVNVMTLGGLALAVGILVDEATVTIET
jgi:AcrB/AcrD/AcrF family